MTKTITIKELKDKLSEFDENSKIIVYTVCDDDYYCGEEDIELDRITKDEDGQVVIEVGHSLI